MLQALTRQSNAVGVLFSKDRSRSLSMERMPNQERSVTSGRSVKSVIPLVLFSCGQTGHADAGTKPFPEFCDEPKFGMLPLAPALNISVKRH
jgi:hypothetical protein